MDCMLTVYMVKAACMLWKSAKIECLYAFLPYSIAIYILFIYMTFLISPYLFQISELNTQARDIYMEISGHLLELCQIFIHYLSEFW